MFIQQPIIVYCVYRGNIDFIKIGGLQIVLDYMHRQRVKCSIPAYSIPVYLD